jgi:hypothetical protein
MSTLALRKRGLYDRFSEAACGVGVGEPPMLMLHCLNLADKDAEQGLFKVEKTHQLRSSLFLHQPQATVAGTGDGSRCASTTQPLKFSKLDFFRSLWVILYSVMMVISITHTHRFHGSTVSFHRQQVMTGGRSRHY